MQVHPSRVSARREPHKGIMHLHSRTACPLGRTCHGHSGVADHYRIAPPGCAGRKDNRRHHIRTPRTRMARAYFTAGPHCHYPDCRSCRARVRSNHPSGYRSFYPDVRALARSCHTEMSTDGTSCARNAISTRRADDHPNGPDRAVFDSGIQSTLERLTIQTEEPPAPFHQGAGGSLSVLLFSRPGFHRPRLSPCR